MISSCQFTFMAYSHWPEPRSGQEPGTNGLYDCVEAFILHLNQDRDRDLLSLFVLVPVPVTSLVPVLFSVNTPLQLKRSTL